MGYIMAFSAQDREVLRKLAAEYMEFALLPIQKEKIGLWKALNRGKMVRPMITLDQLPWNELNVNDELTLQVQDPFWRKFEDELRKQIYKWKHFPVDMVLDPFLTIPIAAYSSGYGLTPSVERLNYDKTSEVDAKHYTSVLTEMEDIEKIKDITITVDEKETARIMQEAEAIFEGVAPVRPSHGFQFHLGVWDYLTSVMGVENIYIDLMDRPEFLHAAMRRVTDATIAGIKAANELKLHNDATSLCHCSYVFTDELLPECGAGKGSTSENCWSFGLAQVFTSVSPAVTEEFELPYISEMARYYGAIYYGCCDRLDDRLEIVKRIPHVRKVSCSPWSDREHFAANIGPDLVMSNKPNPAFLATDSFDENIVRDDLMRTCAAAKSNGVNLEFLQKDVSTVRYQPQRLTEWAKVAMSVVENY